MSTAEAAAAIAVAKAQLVKANDEHVVLVGECAALPNTVVSAVAPLAEAMDAHVQAATSATLAANAQLDVALAALAGPIPPEPPEPTLILERSNVTAPEELAPGALLDAQTITGVVRAPAADGKYRKLVGADGAKGKYGGLCLGLTAKGELEAWVDDGKGIRQAILIAQAGKASFVSFRIVDGATGTKIDDAAVAVTLPNGRVACDGICAIGKGVWNHAWADPISGGEIVRLRLYRVALTDEQVSADYKEWASLIDEDDTGGNGGGGGTPPAGLEPPAGDATQATVLAQGARQTIRAFGAGAGPINELDRVFPRMKANAQKDFDDIHLTLLRLIWSGDGGNLGRSYKPLIDWATERVASYGEKLWVHATGYGYKLGDPIGSANRLAASIKAGTDAGCRLDSVCIQNEPGGTDPHWPDGDHVPAHRQMRAELDRYGLQKIILTGLEYAKDDGWVNPAGTPSNVRRNFDNLNGAGLVPSAVPIGAVHSYGDCTSVHLYDERWLTKGCSIMQLECGFGSNPSVGSRILNDLNTGVSYWSYHLLQSFNPDAPGDYGQKLVDMNGNPNAYYHPYRIISTRFLPGTVARMCFVNGQRPFYTQGSKSSAFAACGKRADGKWVVAAQSNGGGKRQFTFRIPEASGSSGVMKGERCNSGGAPSAYSANMVNGYTRFTVGNNEIAVLVG